MDRFPFGFFANRAADLMRQTQDAFQPPPEEHRAAPPAGRQAIKKLPTVVVAPEDLVDPNNRECCVCLEA